MLACRHDWSRAVDTVNQCFNLGFPFVCRVRACMHQTLHLVRASSAPYAGQRVLVVGFANSFWDALGPLIVPMTVGSVIPATITGVVSYFLIFPVVQRYQDHRRARLAARYQALRPGVEP